MRRDEFEKMAEHLDDFFQALQENPDIRADLAKHVNNLGPQAKSLEQIIGTIDGTEHATFIKDVVDFLGRAALLVELEPRQLEK